MGRVGRRTGEGTNRSFFAAAVALLLLVMSVALGASAGAAAAPKPAPASSPAAAATTTTPGVGLSVDLGDLHLTVKVPLDVSRLLVPPPASKPSGAPAPGSSTIQPIPVPTAGTTHAAYPPTAPQITQPLPGAAHARTTRPTHVHHHHHHAAAPKPRSGPSAGPEPSPTRAHPSRSSATVVFVHRVLPGTGPLILIVLCVACGIAVAIVVRFTGGRRRA